MDAAHDLRRSRCARHIEKIGSDLDPAANVHPIGYDRRNHGDVHNFLDAGNNFVGNQRIDDDPEDPLIFRFDRQPDRAVSTCDPAADADKYRHFRNADDCLRNCRLRREGVNGDDRIGIDVFDDRNVCYKCNGSDAYSENADAAAFPILLKNCEKVCIFRKTIVI